MLSLSWRNIPIAPINLQRGETKAQACAIVFANNLPRLRQGLGRVSLMPVGACDLAPLPLTSSGDGCTSVDRDGLPYFLCTLRA